MPTLPSRPVSALNLYEGYCCRQSGVCCTSGWDIPLHADHAARLAAALDLGTLTAPGACPQRPALVPAVGLPDGATVVTGRSADGACAFFARDGSRLCTVHAALGHDALPPACRHYPRQFLIDDYGVRVSFSHVCPTAAGLLLRDDLDRLHPVDATSMVRHIQDVEGFDARGAILPLVKPRLAGDPATLRVWDEFVLAACGRDESPLQVLARLVRGAEHVRNWTPTRGALAAFADDGLSDVLMAPPAIVRADVSGVNGLLAAVQAATPDHLRDSGQEPVACLVFAWERRSDTWRTANRYLAARAWGAWSAYLGEGLRTQLACLAAALALLGRHLAEGVDAARLSDDSLKAALRDADVRIVHRADVAALCGRFRDVERLAFGSYTSRLGLAWAA